MYAEEIGKAADGTAVHPEAHRVTHRDRKKPGSSGPGLVPDV
jgi:hypothetical protein